jgi:uncharacterized protein
MEFADRYGPWALVAGASEGVGSSAARSLGQRGINVVLVSRRQAALDDVAETVPSSTRTMELDLSEPDAANQLIRATADLEIGLLIYNAGADPNMARFLDKPLDVWQAMLTRNCTTVMASAHHFGGLMAKRAMGASLSSPPERRGRAAPAWPCMAPRRPSTSSWPNRSGRS